MDSLEIQQTFSDAMVDFGNRLADDNPDADLWEIADGMLAGAVHWWLYANAPCENPECEDCESIRNAEARMKTLYRLISEMAQSSDYYHSPNDDNVAHA